VDVFSDVNTPVLGVVDPIAVESINECCSHWL
jgi:hypothetical protein